MKVSAGRHSTADGFLLIELLIALALSAVVALLLLHGIGLASVGLDRLSQSADRLERQNSLDALLRRTVGSAAVLPIGDRRVVFVGEPTRLTFLTIADDAGPGLYRIDLAPQNVAGERVLVLTRRLADPWLMPRLQRSVLVRRLRAFHIAYFGSAAPAEPPAWHDKWTGMATPPRLVRITIATPEARLLPPIVIRLSGVTG